MLPAICTLLIGPAQHPVRVVDSPPEIRADFGTACARGDYEVAASLSEMDLVEGKRAGFARGCRRRGCRVSGQERADEAGAVLDPAQASPLKKPSVEFFFSIMRLKLVAILLFCALRLHRLCHGDVHGATLSYLYRQAKGFPSRNRLADG